jgi:hypothetical protein
MGKSGSGGLQLSSAWRRGAAQPSMMLSLPSDILWNNHLIGDFSSPGLPDYGRAIVPNADGNCSSIRQDLLHSCAALLAHLTIQ